MQISGLSINLNMQYLPQSANAPQSPEDVGNLVLWYDLTDAGTITTSGLDITQIDDKSSNDYHMTFPAGNEPEYSAINGINGQAFAQFQTSGYTDVSDSYGFINGYSPTTTPNQFSMMFIGRTGLNDNVELRTIATFSANGTGNRFGLAIGNMPYQDSGSGTAQKVLQRYVTVIDDDEINVVDAYGNGDQVWRNTYNQNDADGDIIFITYDNGTVNVWINGTKLTTALGTYRPEIVRNIYQTGAGSQIGRLQTATVTRNMSMDFHQLALWDKVLSDSEVDNLTAYFEQDYGTFTDSTGIDEYDLSANAAFLIDPNLLGGSAPAGWTIDTGSPNDSVSVAADAVASETYVNATKAEQPQWLSAEATSFVIDTPQSGAFSTASKDTQYMRIVGTVGVSYLKAASADASNNLGTQRTLFYCGQLNGALADKNTSPIGSLIFNKGATDAASQATTAGLAVGSWNQISVPAYEFSAPGGNDTTNISAIYQANNTPFALFVVQDGTSLTWRIFVRGGYNVGATATITGTSDWLNTDPLVIGNEFDPLTLFADGGNVDIFYAGGIKAALTQDQILGARAWLSRNITKAVI